MNPTHSFKGSRSDLSVAQQSVHNVQFGLQTSNYLLNRNPEYYVYIYNISESTFKVSRSPIIQQMTIGGRKRGERYTLVTKLPQPMLTPKVSIDSDELDITAMDTRRFVTDLLNPDNLGIDQDAVIDSKSITAQGNNLGAKGVFWSLNNPPLKEEVDRAYARMEAYYNRLIEETKAVEVSSPASLQSFLGPEHHAAVDYFGIETSWHGKRSRPMDCPNCGERIKEGAAFHKTDEGVFCILDWSRAIKAGIRTKAQAAEAGIEGYEISVPEKATVPVPKEEPKKPSTETK